MEGVMTMSRYARLAFCLALVLFLNPRGSLAYDPGGRWLLQGTGYAQKGVVRTRLTDSGVMDINTRVIDEIPCIVDYSVQLSLDASLLSINAWSYSREATLSTPFRVPNDEPTLNDPLDLPPVTVDDVTYKITLTSATSGTLEAYGSVDVDYVGRVQFESANALWKEGTPKPGVPNRSSGCNALSLEALAPALLFFWSRTRKRG